MLQFLMVAAVMFGLCWVWVWAAIWRILLFG